MNILVVHGALGSAAQMEPIARALEVLGTVKVLELPGHGSTALAPHETFGMESFVHVLRNAVAECAEAPVVFGYSMGGYVALALEAEFPGSLAGIITLGTKFAWTPALATRERNRLDTKVIAEKIPKFAALLEQRHMDAGGWQTLLDHTASLLAELGDRPLLTSESLGRIECPVCICVGELDDTVGESESQEYASYIPNARCELIHGAPHPIERIAHETIVTLVQSNCLRMGLL